MLSNFFYFVLLFFINNCRLWCWIHIFICCSLKYGFLYFVSRSSLNTLWIIYSSRSSSWNTSYSMSFEILKSLYLFWSNFFEGLFEWIFLASNHMLSPTFSPYSFLLFLLNCFFITSCTAFIDFVASSKLFYNPIKNSSNLRISICTLRFPFPGCFLKFRTNGVCPVATCFLLLY